MTPSDRTFLFLIFCAFGSPVGCSDDAADGTGGDGGGDGSGQTTASQGTGGDASGGGGGGPNEEALAYLATRAGTYEGSWDLYEIDAAQVRALKYSWDDVAIADMPTVEATRAYLYVQDDLTFTFGFDGTDTTNWIEGILLEEGGALGEAFIEQDGVVTIQTEVEPNHYVYQTELSPYDIPLIEGCTVDNLIEGYHTIDKVVTFPGGVETHTISRMTHATCDADAGMITVDYESLTGTHRKTM
jgi:hypothetical protein